ncbi:MAG: SGNH/GDSL hydrolase family protein [Phycisphaeraceae bacterium JB051]
MQNLPLQNGPLQFAGQISLEKSDDGIRPWRLRFDDLPLYHNGGLIGRASAPAGVRMNLISDTTRLTVTATHKPYTDEVNMDEWFRMDLTVDGKFHQRVKLPNEIGKVGEFKFIDIPQGEHRLEIWLDQFHPTKVQSVSIDDNATAKPFNDTRTKWLTYGSSITHGRQAHGPTEVWPALVAAACDLNVTSLGFGGQCHLDPMVLSDIRGCSADIISACVGINIQGSCSYNQRSFTPNVIGMIKTIREGHPVTPLMIISPISSPPREDVPNAVDMSLSDYRDQVKIAVETVQKHDNDKHLFYFDGLELFGPVMVNLMPDQLHPDGVVIHLLGKSFAEKIMPTLLGDLKNRGQ